MRKSRLSAFTLVELMITIAIISILAVVAMRLADDQTPAVDRERSIRLANRVESDLMTTYTNMYLGRGIFTENGIIFPDIVHLSMASTGVANTYLSLSGEVISSGALLSYPFFDGDTKYLITGLTLCDSGGLNSVSFTGGMIILGKWYANYQNSAGNPLNQSIFQMTTVYRTVTRYIIFDRRVGMTEVQNKPYCQ